MHTIDAASVPDAQPAVPLPGKLHYRARHPRPIPQGPLCIVVNAGSGNDVAGQRIQTIRDVLDGAQRAFQLFEVRDPSQLGHQAQQAVLAAEAQDGVIVAAGGDGTLNAVAQRARHSKQPYAILPQGTFNYFGRGLGVSSDLAQTLTALLDGELEDVQVGLVNDHVFLVNASVGLYPELLEEREVAKQRFGRSRAVALFAAARTLLAPHANMTLRIEDGERPARVLRTPTLFVGNSALQLQQVGIAESAALERDHLAAVVLDPVSRLRMLGLLVQGAAGRLGRAQPVQSFPFCALTVQFGNSGKSRRVKVACDGETRWMRTPLNFKAAPRALHMLLPKQRSDGDPG